MINPKKILLPFVENRSDLESKWWHRFFKVAFVLSLVLVALTALVGFYSAYYNSGGTPVKDVRIINNLKDFTKSSSPNIKNTLPLFLDQSGKLGCLNPESKRISYLNTWGLEKNITCNADIVENFESIIDIMEARYAGSPEADIRDSLLKALAGDTRPRYCFVGTGVGCSSEYIVKYERQLSPHTCAVIVGSSIGVALIWFYVWTAIYYKLFIYIVFGKNKSIKK